VVAFACFIVSIALLGLSSVMRHHDLWRAWSEREALRDEDAAGENASW
jgi:hypothetical protein